MNSHGFIEKSVDIDLLNEVRERCFFTLSERSDIDNYCADINNYIDNIDSLISKKIFSNVCRLLSTDKPILCAVELHIQKAGCKGIPPHQDNFYHCIGPFESLKVLIPLQILTKQSGALTFLNTSADISVLEHKPSSFSNFSSFIDKEVFDQINSKATCYKYLPGDSSYHFVNNIHYSDGNKSHKDTLFLVYRYQIPDSKTNQKQLKKYRICYQKYLKNIEKQNNS